MAETMVDSLLVGVGFKLDSKSIAGVLGPMRGAGRDLMAMGSSITNAFGAASLGIVGAAAAIAGFAAANAHAEDATAKLAGRLRTSTEELTALQHAAGHAGVSQQEMTGSLQALNRSLATVAKGKGPAVDAFRALGLSVKNADGTMKSTVQLLPELSDALNGLEDEAKKAAYSQALLGGSSVAMAGMLDGGGDAMRAAMQSARDLGIVLDSQAAKNSEALVDALTDLKAVGASFGRALAQSVTPAVTKGAKALTEMLTAADGLPKVGLDRALRGISWALAGLETPLGKATAGLIGVGAIIGVGKAAGGIGTLLGAMGPLGTAVKALGVAFGGMASTVGIPLLLLAGVALVMEDLYVATQGGESAILDFAKSIGVGDELLRTLQAGLTIATDLFSILSTTTLEVGRNIVQSFGWAADGIASMADAAGRAFPKLKGIADIVKWIAENAGAAFGWLVGAAPGGIASAAEGLAGFTTRLRTGELGENEERFVRMAPVLAQQNALLESARQRDITGEGMGIMGVGMRSFDQSGRAYGDVAREGRAATAQAAIGAINVAVTAGSDARAIAREAADAVYREVLANAAGVEALR